MSVVEDNYLLNYKTFLEKLVREVNPNDQLPLKVACYNIAKFELEGTALHWSYQYLNLWECPTDLLPVISKAALEKVKILCKANPEQCGFNHNRKEYDSLRLMQTVVRNIMEVCNQYVGDSEALSSLPKTIKRNVISMNCIKNKRRSMEDKAVIIDDLELLFDKKICGRVSYYAIFDGHNGVDAAVYSASHLHQFFLESDHYASNPQEALYDAFVKTDREFLRKSDGENMRSGTTAVCVVIRHEEKMLHAAWVGDSEAFLYKRGQVVRLVKPHKADRLDERDRIMDDGGCVILWQGMWRVNAQLAITRAIGDPDYKPQVTSEPDIKSIPLDGDEDFVILASDGLWDNLTPEEAMITVYHNVKKTSGNLKDVSQCLVKRSKSNGSEDNISAIVIFLKDKSEISIPEDMDTATAETYTTKQNGTSPYCPLDTNILSKFEIHNEDYDDLGPETNVDNVDEGAKPKENGGSFKDLHEHEDRLDKDVAPKIDFLNNKPASDKTVVLSEDSDDEWNYYKGDIEKIVKDSRNAQVGDEPMVDDMDFPLNPNAAEFVPVSPTKLGNGIDGNPFGAHHLDEVKGRLLDDDIIARSPRKGFERSIDDVPLPSNDEFQSEICKRPSDVMPDILDIQKDIETKVGDAEGGAVQNENEMLLGTSTRAVFGDESTFSDNLAEVTRELQEREEVKYSESGDEKDNTMEIMKDISASSFSFNDSNVTYSRGSTDYNDINLFPDIQPTTKSKKSDGHEEGFTKLDASITHAEETQDKCVTSSGRIPSEIKPDVIDVQPTEKDDGDEKEPYVYEIGINAVQGIMSYRHNEISESSCEKSKDLMSQFSYLIPDNEAGVEKCKSEIESNDFEDKKKEMEFGEECSMIRKNDVYSQLGNELCEQPESMDTVITKELSDNELDDNTPSDKEDELKNKAEYGDFVNLGTYNNHVEGDVSVENPCSYTDMEGPYKHDCGHNGVATDEFCLNVDMEGPYKHDCSLKVEKEEAIPDEKHGGSEKYDDNKLKVEDRVERSAASDDGSISEEDARNFIKDDLSVVEDISNKLRDYKNDISSDLTHKNFGQFHYDNEEKEELFKHEADSTVKDDKKSNIFDNSSLGEGNEVSESMYESMIYKGDDMPESEFRVEHHIEEYPESDFQFSPVSNLTASDETQVHSSVMETVERVGLDDEVTATVVEEPVEQGVSPVFEKSVKQVASPLADYLVEEVTSAAEQLNEEVAAPVVEEVDDDISVPVVGEVAGVITVPVVEKTEGDDSISVTTQKIEDLVENLPELDVKLADEQDVKEDNKTPPPTPASELQDLLEVENKKEGEKNIATAAATKVAVAGAAAVGSALALSKTVGKKLPSTAKVPSKKTDLDKTKVQVKPAAKQPLKPSPKLPSTSTSTLKKTPLTSTSTSVSTPKPKTPLTSARPPITKTTTAPKTAATKPSPALAKTKVAEVSAVKAAPKVPLSAKPRTQTTVTSTKVASKPLANGDSAKPTVARRSLSSSKPSASKPVGSTNTVTSAAPSTTKPPVNMATRTSLAPKPRPATAKVDTPDSSKTKPVSVQRRPATAPVRDTPAKRLSMGKPSPPKTSKSVDDKTAVKKVCLPCKRSVCEGDVETLNQTNGNET